MLASLWSLIMFTAAAASVLDTAGTLDCHRRLYTYRVLQADENGRTCWDSLSVMSCWGRCDSNEIADWRFPYKRSHHPVCVHAGRTRSLATLRHCEEGVTPGTERYEYLEATTCKCQQCSSTDTSCEGLRYRGQRSQDITLLALGPEDRSFDDVDDNFVH